MARNKIAPALTEGILEQAGRGLSGAEIAAWLEAEHGIKVTGRAVLGLLARTRAEREPITRAVLAEKLGKSVGTDLAALDGVLGRAEEIEREARAAGERDEALRAQDRQLRALELRFKLSGAGQPSGEREPFIVVLPPERPLLRPMALALDAGTTREGK